MAEASTTGRVREPSHAGSWYTADGTALADELGAYLRAVPASASIDPRRAPRAVIAPHAGYSYSGPAAAWAYKAVDPRVVRRVFLLGPSHHAHIALEPLPALLLQRRRAPVLPLAPARGRGRVRAGLRAGQHQL